MPRVPLRGVCAGGLWPRLQVSTAEPLSNPNSVVVSEFLLGHETRFRAIPRVPKNTALTLLQLSEMLRCQTNFKGRLP